eukprot:364906-Chlamydomonas_euryale.AAC.4
MPYAAPSCSSGDAARLHRNPPVQRLSKTPQSATRTHASPEPRHVVSACPGACGGARRLRADVAGSTVARLESGSEGRGAGRPGGAQSARRSWRTLAIGPGVCDA